MPCSTEAAMRLDIACHSTPRTRPYSSSSTMESRIARCGTQPKAMMPTPITAICSAITAKASPKDRLSKDCLDSILVRYV